MIACCTIAASNYTPYCRVLLTSLRAQHPDVDLHVLVVDADRSGEDLCGARVTCLAELDLPDRERMCFGYDLTELATAVKPWFIEQLFDAGYEKVVYLDPDIYVVGSLQPVFDLLDRHDVVLTPHLDSDYPDDGCLPNDSTILRTGLYNLGFLGIRASDIGRAVMSWLKGKLEHKCVNEAHRGYFVDQRFFDLVPILFKNVFILRSPAYNVAYWNLHSRQLVHGESGWICNGVPLCFFHFSGFTPNSTKVISRHLTRYDLDNRLDLRPLFEEYRSAVEEHAAKSRRLPYPWNDYVHGGKIAYSAREFYRNHPAVQARVSDPFRSLDLAKSARLFTLRQLTPAVLFMLWDHPVWPGLDADNSIRFSRGVLAIVRDLLKHTLPQDDRRFLRHVLIPAAHDWLEGGLEWENPCRTLAFEGVWALVRSEPHYLLKRSVIARLVSSVLFIQR